MAFFFITLVSPPYSDNCSLPDLPEWLDSNYVNDHTPPTLSPWKTSELGLDESENEFQSPTTSHYNSDSDVELTDEEVVTLDPHKDEIQPGLRYKVIISFSFFKKKIVILSFHMVQDLVTHRMTSKKVYIKCLSMMIIPTQCACSCHVGYVTYVTPKLIF